MNIQPSLHTSPDQIKRGLERIKEAQIEVLKQLRRQESYSSIMYEDYVKESDSFEATGYRSEELKKKQFILRIHQLEGHLESCQNNQRKLRQQNFKIISQLRQLREKNIKLENTLKKFEKNQSQTLQKAEEALRNAIQSQKKFISMKSQLNKTQLQKQKLNQQLKTLKNKQFQILINSEAGIYAQIAKDLGNLNQTHQQLIHLSSKSKAAKSQNKFQLQYQYEKYLTNILNCLSHGQDIFPHTALNQKDQINQLSRSFREDIRKIEEEIQKGQSQQQDKIKQLLEQVQYLNKLNQKLKNQLIEYQEQIEVLKNVARTQALQLQKKQAQCKILQQQYQDQNKRNKRGRELSKQQKKISNYSQVKINRINEEKEKEIFKYIQKIKELENILQSKENQLLKLSFTNKNIQQMLKKVKNELQNSENKRRQKQQQYNFELLKINTEIQQINTINIKDKMQWRRMIDAIHKFQDDKTLLLQKKQEIEEQNIILKKQNTLQINRLQQKMQELQKQMFGLRKQNSEINYERSQYLRLWKRQNNKYSKNVDDLWRLKQIQYDIITKILNKNR